MADALATLPQMIGGGSVSATAFWFFCCLSVFVVSITKSGFGGSIGALAAPIMLTVMPAKLALGVLLPLYLCADIWTVYLWRGYAVWWLLFWMVLFAVLGQFLGWLVIGYIDDDMLKAVIGVIALVTGGRHFISMLPVTLGRLKAPHHKLMRQQHRKRASVWCSLSGLSSFVSLTGGIPIQVFMLPMKLQRFFVVGTLAWYFLFINVAKLPFFIELDIFTADTLMLSLILLPVVPAGVIVGRWLNKNMSDRLFYHIANAALVILGARLLFGGP